MCSIALVDDRDTILASHTLILELHGMSNTRAYTDPRELINDMRNGFRPDIVVTDFYMPGMNGVELLQSITALYGHIPAVIVSGYPDGIHEMGDFASHYPIICKGHPDFYKDLFRFIEPVAKKSAEVHSEEKKPLQHLG